MNCKCKSFDDIFCCKDELALFFYEAGVLRENKTKIERLGFSCSVEGDALLVRLNDALQDIRNLQEHIKWSEAELEGISALLRKHDEPLTLSAMRDVKPFLQIVALTTSSDVTDIIKNKAFTSFFQPIVTLEDEAIYGYESLLRGVKNDGSIIAPYEIFQTAKKSDKLFYLDRAARETSLKTAAVKRIEKKVFINFLPTAIYNPQNCLQDTVRWANQLEFDPKNIVFEVVETEKIIDTTHLKSILDFYKSHGFLVALDDVGSGYSSLNMLSSIKPDIIKIDREIIDHVDCDSLKQSVFQALIKVAHDHGITVLAEGVERVEEALFVKEAGAQLAQGWFWAKPQAEPVRTIEKKLLH